jgi:hypothetical protein
MRSLPDSIIEIIKSELDILDHEMVDVNGVQMKPSKCYHFEMDPAHVLFNTNCPDNLKQKVQSILAKYLPHESGS